MGAPNLLEFGELREFFAPASADLVDGLIGQYRRERGSIEQIAALVESQAGGAIRYFLDGNGRDSFGRFGAPAVERLFQTEGAIAALNAAYWQRAIDMTDVYDAMPEKRREEWREQIRDMKTPEFAEDTVRATLQDLLASRAKFFAERVDGIFRALSGTHVTNSPSAFGKRMILAGMTNSYYSTERVGYINDLRCVIAKFMGRDEPEHGASYGLIEFARRHRTGQWVPADGGALRVRCYMNGNAHIEVHPDMAWRLNCVLAQMHPNAIPSEFRSKPSRKAREFDMIQRPLPFAVLRELQAMKGAVERNAEPSRFNDRVRSIPNTRAFAYDATEDKHVRAEVARILQSLGAVERRGDNGYQWFEFDYCPDDVILEIVASGCIPDQKAHQFYPTPAELAQRAVELAQIGPRDLCREPSAGMGALADLMPKDRTECVEISPLHCKVLEAKGFRVTQANFLALHTNRSLFDRIVMNPPFSEGRWQAHLTHAASMLATDGRLVSILPAGAKGKDVLPGFSCEWHGPYDNQFSGTSVSVVILVAEPAR